MSENPGPWLLINPDQIEVIKPLGNVSSGACQKCRSKIYTQATTLYFFNVRANKQETPQQAVPDSLCVTAQTPLSSYIKTHIKLLLLRVIFIGHYVIFPCELCTGECWLK